MDHETVVRPTITNLIPKLLWSTFVLVTFFAAVLHFASKF